MSKKTIKEALKSIFSGIKKLKDEHNHTDRKFTIDGRLVGDIGEVIAERDYRIKLDGTSKQGYDGTCEDTGRRVQIKATFKDSLTFGTTPKIYLGLKIFEDGSYEEIYNGPGKNISKHFSHRRGIGEKQLSFPIKVLKELSSRVPKKDRIRKR